MYSTALVSGIRKDFRNGLQHTKILITDDQTYTSKPAFFQQHKERTLALANPFSYPQKHQGFHGNHTG